MTGSQRRSHYGIADGRGCAQTGAYQIESELAGSLCERVEAVRRPGRRFPAIATRSSGPRTGRPVLLLEEQEAYGCLSCADRHGR